MSQPCNWCCPSLVARPAVAVISNDVWAYAVCEPGLARAILQKLDQNGSVRVTGPETLDDFVFGGALRKKGLTTSRLSV